MNRRRIAIAAAALALVAVGSTQQPTASLQILTHDARDLQPRRFQAALDFGVVGVKLLITWTARQLR